VCHRLIKSYETIDTQPLAVLDCVDTRLDCVADAFSTKSVGRYSRVRAGRLVDRRGDFLNAVLCASPIGARGHVPTGGHDFEAVGTRLELTSSRDPHPGFAVRFEAQKVTVPAGDRDRRSGGKDARARDQALVYRISHAECHASSATQVTHRCDSTAQCLSGSIDRSEQQLLIIVGQHIAKRIRRGAEDQVHMTVDQPGQDRRRAQIDDVCARRQLVRRRHACNGAGIHKDCAVALHTAGTDAIDQSTSANYGCSLLHRQQIQSVAPATLQ
jgi:hypothetical protein